MTQFCCLVPLFGTLYLRPDKLYIMGSTFYQVNLTLTLTITLTLTLTLIITPNLNLDPNPNPNPR